MAPFPVSRRSCETGEDFDDAGVAAVAGGAGGTDAGGALIADGPPVMGLFAGFADLRRPLSLALSLQVGRGDWKGAAFRVVGCRLKADLRGDSSGFFAVLGVLRVHLRRKADLRFANPPYGTNPPTLDSDRRSALQGGGCRPEGRPTGTRCGYVCGGCGGWRLNPLTMEHHEKVFR